MPALLEAPVATDTSVAAFCLGEFRLSVRPSALRFGGPPPIAGGVTAEWRSGRARRLLQYLVVHHGRPVAPDALIESLWPNPDATDPGTSLRVSVHLLRQELAQQPGPLSQVAVELSDSGYRLVAPDLWLDVDEFEDCVARGRRLEALGEQRQARAAYARADELYQGEFLAGAWQQWAVLRRESLKDQLLFVGTRLADAAIQDADYQSAILLCQRILQADCYHEPTYRTLMLCHARLGQLGRVRSWYEVCAQALRTELGVAPHAETDRLYRGALGIGHAETDRVHRGALGIGLQREVLR